MAVTPAPTTTATCAPRCSSRPSATLNDGRRAVAARARARGRRQPRRAAPPLRRQAGAARRAGGGRLRAPRRRRCARARRRRGPELRRRACSRSRGLRPLRHRARRAAGADVRRQAPPGAADGLRAGRRRAFAAPLALIAEGQAAGEIVGGRSPGRRHRRLRRVPGPRGARQRRHARAGRRQRGGRGRAAGARPPPALNVEILEAMDGRRRWSTVRRGCRSARRSRVEAEAFRAGRRAAARRHPHRSARRRRADCGTTHRGPRADCWTARERGGRLWMKPDEVYDLLDMSRAAVVEDIRRQRGG